VFRQAKSVKHSVRPFSAVDHFVHKDVPYFCRWESRELAKRILEKQINTDDDPNWRPKIKGGHLVLMVGYDKTKQEFYLHNPSGISRETQEYAAVKVTLKSSSAAAGSSFRMVDFAITTSKAQILLRFVRAAKIDEASDGILNGDEQNKQKQRRNPYPCRYQRLETRIKYSQCAGKSNIVIDSHRLRKIHDSTVQRFLLQKFCQKFFSNLLRDYRTCHYALFDV